MDSSGISEERVNSQDDRQESSTISRRRFLRAGAAFMGAAAAGALAFDELLADENDKITIGMLADVHYADREMRGSRYYRESAAKVEQCIKGFNSAKPDFIIELGDFIDKGKSVEIERGYLERIESEYAKFKGERHYVLGNHDVATFSKKQFISNCGARKNYYSFNKGNFHFVVLDACYNKDGSDYNAGNFRWTETYIPPAEQKGLKFDLRATRKKTVLFVHQRLDDEHGRHGIKNAPEVRKILEQSRKVLAVFQGHDHGGAYNKINGIHYCTLPALVEGSGLKNNAYSLVQIWTDGRIKTRGFGKLKDRELTILSNVKNQERVQEQPA